MPDRPWSDTDRELVADVLEDRIESLGMTYEAAAEELLNQLTAAGWRPPPPEPDGIQWRTGTSVGRTIYTPHGDLAGLMHTPEQARAVVAALNAASAPGQDADSSPVRPPQSAEQPPVLPGVPQHG